MIIDYLLPSAREHLFPIAFQAIGGLFSYPCIAKNHRGEKPSIVRFGTLFREVDALTLFDYQ